MTVGQTGAHLEGASPDEFKNLIKEKMGEVKKEHGINLSSVQGFDRNHIRVGSLDFEIALGQRLSVDTSFGSVAATNSNQKIA